MWASVDFSKVGAAWTHISVVYLGGVGLVFVALIAGWVSFIACFIWHGGIWDLVVYMACEQIVWSEDIWFRCIRHR